MLDKLQEIENLATSSNGGDRCKAVEGLAGLARFTEWREHPRTFGLLKALAADSKYEVRQAFAEQSVLLPEEWIWKLLPPLLDDPNPFVRRAAQRARKQRGATPENEDQPSSSRRMTLDELATRIESAVGKEPAAFRKSVNAALRDAQIVKVSEFAHELKNLLHPLGAAVGSLRGEMSPHTLKKHSETLNRIAARAKRLDDFCDAMKFLVEGKTPHYDLIKLEKVVDLAMQNVTDLAAERDVRLQVREVADCNVRVVVERLTRALGNILRNAIEASPKAGTVTFSALLQADSGEVKFIIRDQGRGIKPEARKVIFDALASGKKEKDQGEHMGMGLFIAHTVIVSEHKGEIEVDSDGASWTVFKASIPQRGLSG